MEHFRNKAEQMKEAGWGLVDIRNAITQEIRQSPEYHEKHRGWEGKVPLINQLVAAAMTARTSTPRRTAARRPWPWWRARWATATT